MDPEPERTAVLARDTHFHAIHSLFAMLPRPITDDPEALARRDGAVMAQVASRIPVNADEVALNATRSLLLRTQAVRRKREAYNAAAGSAAWAEHFVLRDMLEAMGRKANGEPEATPATAGETRVDPPVVTPSAPAAADRAPQNVSYYETLSHLSGNETMMRRGNHAPTDCTAPDRPSESCPPVRHRCPGPQSRRHPAASNPEAGRFNAKPSGDEAGGENRLSRASADRAADLLRRAELFSTTSLFSTTGLS